MRRTLLGSSLLAVSFVLVGCASDPSDPASMSQTKEAPRYEAEAFFENTDVGLAGGSGYAWGPNAETILISSNENGVWNAYALNAQTGEQNQLTDNDDTTYALSYFPNDGRIIYTTDPGGSELNKIFVRETDGATRNLTPSEGAKAFFSGFSEDGETIYVMTNERDPAAFDLYSYDATNYERELVFANPGGFNPSDLSDDGRYLVLSKNNSSADSDLYLVDLTTASPEPRLITPHEGNVSHGSYGFTPENDALIYATNAHGEYNEAWRYDLASGETSPFFKADWDVSYVSYSPTGRYLVTGVNADARTRVEITDTRTGRKLRKFDVEGDLSSFRFTPDETRFAANLYSDVTPGDIVVGDLKTMKVRQLTDTINPAIDPQNLVESEVIRYESFDGTEIPSILWKPKGASADNPAPAIVLVHGGPGGQTRTGYSPMVQHLVNHGYVVLGANNRGSSGYGKTFYHMDDKRHGEVDLQDIVYGKKWLEEQDWIDGDNIAIMGGSYGGYMVAAALAFEPDVFDAGVNIFGVTNWLRTLESIPAWWGPNRAALFDELGDPATDAERLRRISPLFHAEKITKPLLVVQGANDPRVLQVESDELVEKVRANGVPVEYVLFEDEGHGFRKQANRIEAQKAYLAFLNEHLDQ
ncbi:MAG: S9 family peptidase [Parvularcula sp.]|jgi:dipeptidyl aminopeptidase/acylaminoacyl peptidase|nr:S9 family peptidase [Parvularcula sp.]